MLISELYTVLSFQACIVPSLCGHDPSMMSSVWCWKEQSHLCAYSTG